MTEQREFRIPYDDLKYISFECNSCGVEITIDLSNDECQKLDWEHKVLRCAVCTMSFDSQITLGLASYIKWYKRISGSGHKVFFRVKETLAK